MHTRSGLHQHIVFGLDNTFAELRAECHLAGADERQFANRAAHYLGEINATHPFREGNGRTQREFIRELAHRNGYVLHWSRISQGQMIEASRQSLATSNAGLERLLWDVLEK